MAVSETSVPVPAPGSPVHSPRSGLLKWGLVGCGVLSAVLIVGLVLVGMKARTMMQWALGKMEEQTLQSCTPDVTQAEREAFKAAYAGFVARASQGKVPVEKMTAFRTKIMAAIRDGKVTPDELRDLTLSVGENPPPK